MTDREEGLDDKLKALLADEALSDSYSTPLPMQREQNARRNEKFRSLAIEQAAEITRLRAQVVELTAWIDFSCRMYLTDTDVGEIDTAVLLMKLEARAALNSKDG